jgi:hypothetical protein
LNDFERAMPGKPFQSKLLPHAEFIRECRADGMGYRQIAAELRDRFGMRTAPANVFSFVKVRARRRPVFALPPRESAATAPGARSTAVRVTPTRPATSGNWLNYDPSKPLEKIPP